MYLPGVSSDVSIVTLLHSPAVPFDIPMWWNSNIIIYNNIAIYYNINTLSAGFGPEIVPTVRYINYLATCNNT